MSDEKCLKKSAKYAGKTSDGIVKGSQANHTLQGKSYKVKLDTLSSCKVNVLNKVGKAGKMEPIFRLDKAHHSAEFNHINLNSKYSGLTKQVTTSTGKVKTIPYDPYTKLPTGALTAGKGTAKLCQMMNKTNKVLVPIAIAVDTCRVGYAGYDDYQNGNSRNTVETTANIAGGRADGYGGAMGEAAVDYDSKNIICESCGKEFKPEKYKGEKYCDRCVWRNRVKPNINFKN